MSLYREKVTLFVKGTCGAAWNSSFVPRKLSSSHHDVIIPREGTLIGRGFRVAVPKSLRQYLSVCRRDFPMQGDVAPKVWNCSKTFMSKTTEGVRCTHTLGRKPILFVIKVLEFLKPFSKGFKRSARQSLATLSPRPSLAALSSRPFRYTVSLSRSHIPSSLTRERRIWKGLSGVFSSQAVMDITT